MFTKCPGADRLRDVTITEKTCPDCGRPIEIFSIFPVTQCECGFTAYNETQSCVKWCRYARACVGEELYEKLMESGQNDLATIGMQDK